MLPVAVVGVSYKSAPLWLQEEFARAVRHFHQEPGRFFPHPTVVLSTCNRTEIYFSADEGIEAERDLLSFLRLEIKSAFEPFLYTHFGVDCFIHLCRVTAGLDSAIFAETEIQGQVKCAYLQKKQLSSALHFLFQKALKIGRETRNRLQGAQGGHALFEQMWSLANWQGPILLVGNSQINRRLFSFLLQKKVKEIVLCTRFPQNGSWKGAVRVVDRAALSRWTDYPIVVTATYAEKFLIEGEGNEESTIFDLSIPRNVDPELKAKVYNLQDLLALLKNRTPEEELTDCKEYIRQSVLRLQDRSKFCLAGKAGEGDHIADVFHASDK